MEEMQKQPGETPEVKVEENPVVEDYPETGETENEMVTVAAGIAGDETKEDAPFDKCVGMDARILSVVSELNSKMDEMNSLFVRKIQHTEHEEKIVDQMHAELQKYKDDLYSQLVRPILVDIIDIRESILHVADNYVSKPEEERNIPIDTFVGYTYDIEDILDKNNIVIYESSEGDEYVPIRHKIVKKVTTHVEELHGRISECYSSGYEYMGKTVMPEKVAVYVYQKEESKEESNNG